MYKHIYIYTHHIFFNPSSIHGHLGCLAIVNNVTMNIGCMYLFELIFSGSLDIYPGVELLSHMLFLFF